METLGDNRTSKFQGRGRSWYRHLARDGTEYATGGPNTLLFLGFLGPEEGEVPPLLPRKLVLASSTLFLLVDPLAL